MGLRQDFGSSPPSTQQHEGFIHGDAYQPGRKLRFFLKVVEMQKSLVKRLLDHIFGILPVIGYALRRGKHSPRVTKNQFLEAQRLSTLCGDHQSGVGVFVHTACTKHFHVSPLPRPSGQQPTLNKAIAVPEAVGEEDRLEMVDRMGDASIHGHAGNVSRHANLSECWHSVNSSGWAAKMGNRL